MTDGLPIGPPTKAARDMHRGRLFRKYLLLILSLVTVVLGVSSGINLYFSYQENRAALASLQREKAIGAASRIEQYIRQVSQQLAFASLPQLDAADVESRRIEFLKLLRQAPEVTDIAQLDATGKEQIALSRLGMDTVASGRDRSLEPAFQKARRGQPWCGPVYFRKETEPYMTVAIRAGGEKSPVTVAEVNLKFIWDVVSRIKIGDKGKAYVVDGSGLLVADPDIGLVLRKTSLAGLTHVQAAAALDADGERAMVSKDLAGTPVLTSVVAIKPLDWAVFVEQPIAEVYAKLNASILRTGLLLLAGLVISALAASALARSMVRPIRTLDEGARRIGEGHLEQQIVVRTGDELEGLADQFNRMTAQLRESYAGLECKVEQRTAEMTEALEYQTAISDVLSVISESPTDVAPVFEAILSSASRLFAEPLAAVFRFDGRLVHLVATRNWPPEAIEDAHRLYPGVPNPAMMSGRVILSGKVDTEEDALANPRYDETAARAGHWRRMIGAPLLKDGSPVGALVIAWPDPGKTPKRQADLLKTFADQAVIAIENVRLINETNEALEQQTATAEILKVISNSPTDVQPVLDAVAQRAALLCDATAAQIFLTEGGMLHSRAAHSPAGAAMKIRGDTVPIDATSMTGRAVLERMTIHCPDVLSLMDTEYPAARSGQQRLGFRAILAVPLIREGGAYGTIFLYREEPRPFLAGQISLVQTFARQAAIAIENVRLFNETKEALEQQTATSEVLKAISRTSFELEPVLRALIENATRLCKSERGFVFIRDGDAYLPAASHGASSEQLEFMRGRRLTADSRTLVGRVALMRQVVHIEDAKTDAMYEWNDALELLGFRTMLGVPMLREGEPIGVVAIWRNEVRPFSARDTQLVASFADQAVIAIENVRLFREIQDKRRELEIANQHKSEFLANMSHELRTPLNAIIGFSEVLLERMFGELNEKQADYLNDIFTSGKHLLSLINDILDLSKIEAGRMELDLDWFDPAVALGNAMTLVRERAQQHGIALSLDTGPQPAEAAQEIYADPRKFKQIMLNLLSNAVKFTPDGGKVGVRATLVDGLLEVAVSDTGIGIAKADHATVFEAFRQVGHHYTNKQEGTGLGLSLTQRFVELHGGTLKVESEVDQGSTFTFTIPRQP